MTDRATILILDENAEEVMQLSAYMEASYDIAGLEEGEDCIDRAISSDADLILIDDMLMDPNCYELCEILKRDPATAHIPTILMSDLPRQELESELDTIKCDDYIAKPFDKAELMAKIETLLSFHKVH